MLNHFFFLFVFFFFFFFFFFSKVRVGAKEGGSHYWEMAVAITCGYGGYLLPLLAAHSSLTWNYYRFFASAFILIKQSFELHPCWKMSNWKHSDLLAWWYHGMDEFSALVALCDGNLQSLYVVILMAPSLGVLQRPWCNPTTLRDSHAWNQ